MRGVNKSFKEKTDLCWGEYVNYLNLGKFRLAPKMSPNKVWTLCNPQSISWADAIFSQKCKAIYNQVLIEMNADNDQLHIYGLKFSRDSRMAEFIEITKAKPDFSSDHLLDFQPISMKIRASNTFKTKINHIEDNLLINPCAISNELLVFNSKADKLLYKINPPKDEILQISNVVRPIVKDNTLFILLKNASPVLITQLQY